MSLRVEVIVQVKSLYGVKTHRNQAIKQSLCCHIKSVSYMNKKSYFFPKLTTILVKSAEIW